MKTKTHLFTIIMCLALCITFFPKTVNADSSRILTLGENLSAEDEANVLSSFGIKDKNDFTVITINNTMERDVLLKYVPESMIGTKTVSCALIEPTTDGGINIETSNLTYVSKEILANALMTAGVNNCNLKVTAPYPVSGTGALTGVYKAYEKLGIDLSDDKKDVATEELIVTSDLAEKHGPEITVIVTEIKDQVIGNLDNMSDDDIRALIIETSREHGLELSDDEVDTLVKLIRKIASLGYELDAFKTKVNETINTLNDLSEKGKAAGNFISRIITAITSFFNKLFGK